MSLEKQCQAPPEPEELPEQMELETSPGFPNEDTVRWFKSYFEPCIIASFLFIIRGYYRDIQS